MGPPERTYKVVFAGDAAVGKSTFIVRLCKGYFVNNIASTLGVDYKVKTLSVDEKNIAIQLWDTAGECLSVCVRGWGMSQCGVSYLSQGRGGRQLITLNQRCIKQPFEGQLWAGVTLYHLVSFVSFCTTLVPLYKQF
ncbi:Ras and EF-hand domain-containing [Portunus trituberculatus]|uniref:Ras and EF-hand domain-containing n=1 Tax=Portunus trituberculatus TaxID=210409 RepID=A0A5B7GMB3_PORTR|nr:Ras and EF-hand domain-containing [Portunus trituberculatus]